MQLRPSILARYFGLRFLLTVIAVFGGMFLLVVLVDYIEMSRRTEQVQGATAAAIATISLFRVPQIMEQILPFCILIGAMACYLSLSRRLELVIARAAGVSAWQFVTPALAIAIVIGIGGATIYNPVAAILQEHSKRLEAQLTGNGATNLREETGSFWMRQRGEDGQSIINARASRNQGLGLSGVRVFAFDDEGRFRERIEARSATLEAGFWRLDDARIYTVGAPPREQAVYRVSTTLTKEQVRESFATPDTVPFWQLPAYIESARNFGLTAAGYRYQYYKLIALPFLLGAMVLLAASVSLRFFRFGGVQKMVLGGVGGGFLLYVLSKITRDLSTAELMHPVVAAWLPVLFGGLTGFVVLLYQEDG